MRRFEFLSRFARWVLQRELAHIHSALRRAERHADHAEMLLEECRTRLDAEKRKVQALQEANRALVAEIESLHKAKILRAEFDQHFGGTD